MDDLAPALWAETLLAVVGMRRALDTEPLKLLVRDREAALALPRRIVSEFRASFADDELTRAKPLREGYDWPWLRDRLSAPVTVDDVASNVVGFDNIDEAVEFAQSVERVRAHLAAQAPHRTRQTTTGITDVDPTGSDDARFRRTWHVADDPMVVVEDMRSGIMTRGQVRDLGACYPALAAYVRRAAFASLATRLERSPKYQVPYQKDLLLRSLLGAVAWTAGLAAELQAAVASERQEQPPAGAGGGPLDAGAESVQTPTQRVAAK